MVTYQSLYSALAPLGFESSGLVSFGTLRGYAITIKSAQYSIFQLGFAVRVDKKDKALTKNLQSALKAQLGKSFTNVLNAGNSLLFAVKFDGKSPLMDQFRRFVDTIVATLQQNGIAPAAACAVCGGGTPDSLCMLDTFQPVHASCLHQKVANVKDAAEENRQNGSYLTGTLGALLGALVGSIPTILMLFFTDTIYSILFALVPLAAMFGYRLFKGKSDKLSIVIVVVLSILSVGFIAVMYFAYTIHQNSVFSFFQSLSLTFRYFDMEDYFDLFGEFWQGFLFMVLGIVFSWSYLAKTSAFQTQSAEAQLNTLRPNPMFAAQQADAYAQPVSYEPYQQ